MARGCGSISPHLARRKAPPRPHHPRRHRCRLESVEISADEVGQRQGGLRRAHTRVVVGRTELELDEGGRPAAAARAALRRFGGAGHVELLPAQREQCAELVTDSVGAGVECSGSQPRPAMRQRQRQLQLQSLLRVIRQPVAVPSIAARLRSRSRKPLPPKRRGLVGDVGRAFDGSATGRAPGCSRARVALDDQAGALIPAQQVLGRFGWQKQPLLAIG